MTKTRPVVKSARALNRQLAEARAELTVLRAMAGLKNLAEIADDIGPPGSVRTCGISLGDGRDMENAIVRLPGTQAQPYRFKVFSNPREAHRLAQRLCHAGAP